MKKRQRNLPTEDPASGMHEIKNDKRPRFVRRKKGGLRLSGKRFTRARKAAIAISAAAVVALGAFGINALFSKEDALVIDSSYKSTSIALEEGETYSLSGGLTGAEIFGRLNWKFHERKNWSADVQGWVTATAMGIPVTQDVQTYKRYSDGMLISADITKSTLVNAAREFCYVEALDRVVWREADVGPSGYDKFDTKWSTGAPRGNMNIVYHEDLNNNERLDAGEDKNGNGKLDIGFKATRGLPAYELSVYVINDDEEDKTVLSWDVKENEDGTYTLTFQLDPEIYPQEDGSFRGATTYYRNQMKFTGGLPELPTFKSITASFTFDKEYNTVRTNIEEYYTAVMGVSAACTATSQTDYRYDEDNSDFVNSTYKSYFEQYIQSDTTDVSDPDPDALGCLGQAFAPVLEDECALSLNLTLDGKPISGIVKLDLNLANGFNAEAVKAMSVSGKIGSVEVYLDKGVAYLSMGNWKLSLSVEDLLGLIQNTEETPAAAPVAEEQDPLTQLAGGTFVYDKEAKKATLDSTIALGPVTLPLHFVFDIGEKNAIALDSVSVQLDLFGYPVAAELRFTSLDKAPSLPDESELATYLPLMPYAKSVYDLVQSEALHADLGYEGHGFTVEGGVDIALSPFAAKGDVTVSYGEQTKTLSFVYADDLVCLDLDGVKLSANVQDALSLIEGFLPQTTAETEGEGASETEGLNVRSLLEKLFDGTLLSCIDLSEAENVFQVAVHGNDLLQALGVSFNLGEVALYVKQQEGGCIGASALGVTAEVTRGETFTPETSGYPELTNYVSALSDLFSAPSVKAEVGYEGGGLTVDGTLFVALDPIAVKGTVSLSYGAIDRTLGVQYEDGVVYLELDELKLSLDGKKAVSIISDLLGSGESEEATDILETLFSFRFGDMLTLSETEGSLSLVLKGTDLLRALGVTMELGDVNITLGEGGLSASAEKLGLTLSLTAGEEVTTDTAGYRDVTPVLEKVPEVLQKKGLALQGALDLTLGETTIVLEVEDGRVSWANGIEAYLKASLLVGDSRHELVLSVANKEVTIVYGDMGLQMKFTDFTTVKDALLDLYNRLRTLVGGMLVEGTENPLPELSDLFNKVEGAAILAEASPEPAPAWTETVQSLRIGPSSKEGGILSLTLGELTAEVLNDLEGGLLALSLEYTTGDVSVRGSLRAAASDESFPALPEATLITGEQTVTFLGYLGSAFELLTTTDLTLSFEGTVTSSDVANYPPEEDGSDGVKYTIAASMETHRDGVDEEGKKKDLLHIDVNGKNLWVDGSVYAHASINVMATNEKDTSLYIDFFIVDGAPEETDSGTSYAKKDGMLDFYVTLSQYGPVGSTAESVPGYNPVRLYAPSSEILTVLSAAVTMLGADADAINPIVGKVVGLIGPMLNDYMVSKWITDGEGNTDNAMLGRLQAFGNLLAPMLGGLFENDAAPVALAEADAPKESSTFYIGEYLKQLSIAPNGLTITLNSEAVFGKTGLNDVQAILEKDVDTTDEGGNRTYGKFRKLNLSNIYGNDCTENTSLKGEIGYEEVTPALPTGTYQSFLGAEKLILALVNSATHEVAADEVISGEETPHTYAINNNFYIDGSATIKLHLGGLNLADINIRIIAISVTVDDAGKLGINIRFAYEGVRAVLNTITLINGTSTADITIKGGMVYMKRVQTTDSRNNAITPVTIYRVAPLGSFTADILDHLAFILNFGDMVTNALSSATGSGSTSSTSAKVDFGKRLSDVLSAYTFADGAEGASWDLTLNGDALVKGVLGDLNVSITENENGYIHDITASTSVVSIIDATVSLHWRNPGGKMEDNVTDQTHDIVAEDHIDDKTNGFGGMTEKLLAQGWGTEDYGGFTTFLEGQKHTVTFKHNGTAGEETLGSQDVIASTGADGYAERAVYSALNYPDLSDPKYAPQDELQVAGWTEYAPGKALPEDYVVWTKEHGRPLEVTFRFKTELGDGWKYDEAQRDWYYKIEMWYGAKIVFGGTTETVTDDNNTFDVGSYDVPPFPENAREGHWQKNPEIASDGATFVAEYDPDSLTYHSEVAYTVTGVVKNVREHKVEYGNDYTVYTPTAKGYTFLGWYEHQADGSWTKIETGTRYELGTEYKERTLEALWVSNLSVTLTKAERSNKQTEGSWIKTTYYDYEMEAVISGGVLVGAFAEEATLELTCSFDAFTDNLIKDDVFTIGSTQNLDVYPSDGLISAGQKKVKSGDTPRAHVQIKYTYKGTVLHDTGEVIATGEWADA